MNESKANTRSNHLPLKGDLIEILKTIPSIQLACQKIGIGRATYYRWLQDDETFKADCSDALAEGVFNMNAKAEADVFVKIANGDWRAVTYWLRHRHDEYKPSYLVVKSNKTDETKRPPCLVFY